MSETTRSASREASTEALDSPAIADGKIETVRSGGQLPEAQENAIVAQSPALSHQPIRGRRRLIWLVVGLVALAGVVVWGLWLKPGSGETDEVASAPTETSEVQLRDLAETQEYTGQLQYDDAVVVAAAGSGYLTGLTEDGDVVERGDVVYRLSNDPGEAELLSAEQQVVSAESQLANANEQRSTLTAGPSAAELSSAQASVAQAQLSLERLTEPPTQAELATAQAQLAQANAAYSDLFNGPNNSELAALQGDLSRAQQSYDQAVAAKDMAWIGLLSAQAPYCALNPIPVSDLCTSADLPLTDSDVSNLTAAIQSALTAGDNATVAVIQPFISASNSYDNATASVSIAAASLSTAQASLNESSDGPTQGNIDQALAAVLQAEESVQGLVAGPDPLELTQAEAGLVSAQGHLDELLAGATASERQQAVAAVETSKIALEISQLQMSELVAAPTAVTLLYGDAISWRTLSFGSSPGSDILQLEQNLAALGFDPDGTMIIDDVFDEATEQAVMRWQESLGTTVDGSVAASDILYSPGPAKAGAPGEGVELGMAVNSGLVLVDLVPVSRVVVDANGGDTVESTQKVIVTLPVDDRDLVEEGTEVVVELADGTEVAGLVASIGPPITGDSGSTVEVAVVPVEPIDDIWTGTNVSVVVTTELVQQVIAVPVSALLALVEGGYAVEVLEADGSTRLIGIETGMYADGVVEVSGDGLSEGMNVVVPG